MSTPEKSLHSADGSSRSASDRSIELLLDNAIQDSILTGGVLIASRRGEVVTRLVRGSKLPGGNDHGVETTPLQIDTVFDLNGLTSTICTASIVMRLVAAGKISLTDRCARFLQQLGVGNKALITLAHLLSHTSGFPAAPSLYDELVRANSGSKPGILSSSGAKQYAYSALMKLPLRFEPGTKHLFSEINPIILGYICEVLTGLSLDRAFNKLVAAPLQLKGLSFIDLTLLRRKNLEPVVEMFAPSGECPKRGKLIAGQVWDENACIMGGVAGHSGLFGMASDVHAWAYEMVRAWGGQSEFIPQSVIRSFFEFTVPGSKSATKLGFDMSTREDGFVDQKVAPDSVFAASSTGSSIFIDPIRELVVVLLSNAGYSGHINRRFPAVRADIHTAIIESL